ncbi:O-antigen/teichoic acid export membrane protein [Bacillus sp. SORGH_AS 510]|uniref:flippase n=1 Tax=Bacillus sp. SORGH_AS_0510 TaxID=3041771 RepID=UPI002786CFF0|nr:flippase [Bacillus sp. SORGH_AS_0510]MDQ1143770.1 O-antigen/teichoic acid export membrane protein [Bacillus sp. SORGH_AS_0510]
MSLAKNYIYNMIYQIFTLIMPLITVPYISRVLGSNGVGINAYTYSIIQYFILFGTIGISLYGNRVIAYVRDNKMELSRTFWGIFYLKCITTFFALLIFLIFLYFSKEYQNIFLLQSLYLISATLDISWLFMGLEDFKKTVVRNLLLKVLGVICVFTFVKSASDLWKYILILALAQLIGQLTMWLYLPQTVNRIKVRWNDVKKHFMPSLYLFVPQIAVQVYVVLNKTMLGSISNTTEVGYFDNSEKITKMALAVVTAMGVVMLPRISNTFAKGDMKKVKDYLYQTFEFASYLSFPMMFGLAGIANEFTPWFFGPGFSKTGIIIGVISPIIVFIAWSNVLGLQYLMPVGKVKGYTISVCAGAVINFILNLILIKNYTSLGTAIATVVAEFAVTAVQLFWIRRDIEIHKLFNSTWKYLISSLTMYCFLRIIGRLLNAGLITTIIQVIVGFSIYILLLLLLKSKINQKLLTIGWGMVRGIFKN